MQHQAAVIKDLWGKYFWTISELYCAVTASSLVKGCFCSIIHSLLLEAEAKRTNKNVLFSFYFEILKELCRPRGTSAGPLQLRHHCVLCCCCSCRELFERASFFFGKLKLFSPQIFSILMVLWCWIQPPFLYDPHNSVNLLGDMKLPQFPAVSGSPYFPKKQIFILKILLPAIILALWSDSFNALHSSITSVHMIHELAS